MEEVINARRQQRSILESKGGVVATFELHKVSPRVNGTVGRILEITEKYIIEREPETYSIVSTRMYKDIASLVRDSKEPNRFQIFFYQEQPKTYLCSQRDALLATISFNLKNCSNAVVLIQCRPTYGLTVMGDPTKATPIVLETTYLTHLTEVEKEAVKAEGDNLSVNFVKACAAMNANIDMIGMNGEVKLKILTATITALGNQLQIVSRMSDIPPIPASILLESAFRVIYTYPAKKIFSELSGIQATMFRFLKHKDESIVFWANEVMGSLLRGSSFGERDLLLERTFKNEFLSVDKLTGGMMLPLEKYSGSGAGALVILSVMETLEVS